MKGERVELICRDNCPFYKNWGEYPCATANKGDMCQKVNHAITHVYWSHPTIAKKAGNDVEIYMNKEKVGILTNGVVTPQF